jgi:hypothetical protein
LIGRTAADLADPVTVAPNAIYAHPSSRPIDHPALLTLLLTVPLTAPKAACGLQTLSVIKKTGGVGERGFPIGCVNHFFYFS